ncbi:hypothetical protein WUBG_15487 [Wuchereria bancrofti]|uniref:Uncharacterized protein n=1 Tax=Wuchereria bancrofti TaxID=6293 RepID=J9E9H3_WUCBA|nr:hypothetical protein WUBG_15487 [Wuchereria bancrofti]
MRIITVPIVKPGLELIADWVKATTLENVKAAKFCSKCYEELEQC